MGARSDTRSRMIASAVWLLSTEGLAGASIAKVLAHSGGPRGSVQFHFPGGRSELLGEALRHVGGKVTERLQSATVARVPPVDVVAGLCEHYKKQLRSTDFAAACPVWAAVQEAHYDPELGALATRILEDWAEAITGGLIATGRHRSEARDLASFSLATVEGAIVLSRVRRSTRPIDVALTHLRPLLQTSTATLS